MRAISSVQLTHDSVNIAVLAQGREEIWEMSFWEMAAKKTLCLQQQWGLTSAQAAFEITVWIHLNNSHEAQPNASLALLGRDPTSP